MEADWRAKLQEEVRKILEAGGPPPRGELIDILTYLNEPDYEKFAIYAGRLNDLPFGEAAPGTLQIRPPARRGDGNVQLSFLFRPHPPKYFGSSRGLMSPVGPGGTPRFLITGIDFNSLPGLVFPADREELKAIEEHRRKDALVPVPYNRTLSEGDRVTFAQISLDRFGTPIFLRNGDVVSAKLNEVRDEKYDWADKRVYHIAWDPHELLWGSSTEPAHAQE
jgi:hypothetical protein